MVLFPLDIMTDDTGKAIDPTDRQLSTSPQNVYRRDYYASHPDKIMQGRIRCAINLLTRFGYTVSAAAEGGVQA